MKTVIITGAGGNLGVAVTERLLDSGYRVMATVASEAAKKDLPAHRHLEVEVVDLTDEAQAAAFVASAIGKHERLDAALLLVGGFAMGNIETTTGCDLKKQYVLNFETAYFITRPLFAHMMQAGNGRIVFIGSRPSLVPGQGKNVLAYGLSKSLLFKLAEYLNEEAKGKDVTATVVVPSTLDTPLNRQQMPASDPGNWVRPGDLAGLLEFIISEQASVLRETVIKAYNNS